MRITVDRGQCESNALCVAASPGVFSLDADDQLRVVEHPDPGLRDDIEYAVSICPKQALTLSD